MGREVKQDVWAAWLRHRRHGGDVARHEEMLEGLKRIRDRVLEDANLEARGHLLDVGCGDGLIAFGALEKCPDAQVTFCDISQDLLDQCRATADETGVRDRCTFVRADAEDLQGIEDGSCDAVTTRSVLIYVPDKARALGEFHRVLKPGGRVSLFEPINRFPVELPSPFRGGLFGYDTSEVAEIAKKFLAAYRQASSGQKQKLEAMADFDERDLVGFVAEAGFCEVHLELKVDVGRDTSGSWDGFLHSSPNPLQPTMAEAIREFLSEDEGKRLMDCLRPQVEAGERSTKSAVAFLNAEKSE